MNGAINTPAQTDIMCMDGKALTDLHFVLKTLEMLLFLN
jgi:hypothetical protein